MWGCQTVNENATVSMTAFSTCYEALQFSSGLQHVQRRVAAPVPDAANCLLHLLPPRLRHRQQNVSSLQWQVGSSTSVTLQQFRHDVQSHTDLSEGQHMLCVRTDGEQQLQHARL
jgi:hypothetical protein